MAGATPLASPAPTAGRRWGGIVSGRLALHRLGPAAIWSTYPLATAHLIGAALARSSKLPWVADFRDPMAQDGYPPDPAQCRQFQATEQRTVARLVYIVDNQALVVIACRYHYQ